MLLLDQVDHRRNKKLRTKIEIEDTQAMPRPIDYNAQSKAEGQEIRDLKGRWSEGPRLKKL